MKIKVAIVMTSLAVLLLSSCGKNAVKTTKIKSREDSLSYAFGIVNYNALKSDSLTLDPMLVAKAMLDGENLIRINSHLIPEPHNIYQRLYNKVLDNRYNRIKNRSMSDEIARSFIMVFINEREAVKKEKQAELNKVTFKDYIDQNEAFLVKNKEKSGVTITPSGLQYEVIKMGTGAKPTAESTVKVHYVGTLIDGTEFDSSVRRNEPATFPVSGVIPGWTEALQLMPVGSKFKICLPESIAYGAAGAGEVIKPYSTLIFEVELLEIVQ
jgi:FKBP-type peptidyl-prolyl cis-trans isomerase FklB